MKITEETKYAKLAKEFGEAELDGVKVALTEAASDDNCDGYVADAIDSQGRRYKVRWNLVEGWRDHSEDANGDCVVDDCDGRCKYNEYACDWDEVESIDLVD